jgi:3',5'-cyclic-AMP phosphodiesterase
VGSYLLVQLSDVHLADSGVGPHDARTRDNLLAALREVAAAGLRPDVFLLTGDLADAGEGPCYDDLAAIMAEAAAGTGASVIFLPGNHDERAAFRRHLLGEAGDGAGLGAINRTYWRDSLRIIALDSTIPGEDGGALDERTLDYLRAELRAPAPDGTILALHHPPLSSPVAPMAGIALRDPARLRDAIAGSDVRIVLCGHSHHEQFGLLGATPVWVSPAVAYRLDVTSTQAFHGVPGAALSRVDITGDGPRITVIPVPVD